VASETEALVGKVPPQNLEAEASVLGAMLLDTEAVGDVVQMLRSEHFYRSSHREIYSAIVTLYDNNQPIDLLLLKEELSRRNTLEKVGGGAYLAELVDTVPSSANAERYATIVRDKAAARRLIRAAAEIQSQAYDESVPADVLLDHSERAIFEVRGDRIAGTAVRIGDVLKSTFDRIDDVAKGTVTGLETGFYDLDEMTCGLQSSELIVLAARPSMGKTSLCLNIVEHVGVDLKKPVAVFSLEMARQQLAQNMLCSRARIDSHKLRKGYLADSEWPQLSRTVGVLSEGQIYIDDTPGLTALGLRAKARRLMAQQGIALVVVDYLQLMDAPGFDSRQQQISDISRSLKALARELEVPVVAVSQLNRSVETREGHRPRMADLRESGAIEQDADVVLLLHRPDYYQETEDNRGKAELIISKQRNGPTGMVEMSFRREYMRFESLSRRAGEEVPF
jgi:replicative DNA helicase